MLPAGVLKLFHRDFGGAGKPSLVVIHGLLGSSRNWQTVGADLSAQRHVLALDLRNHGMSPHAANHDFATMEADVLRIRFEAQAQIHVTYCAAEVHL